MPTLNLFARRRRRVVVATYPNGLRYVFQKVRYAGRADWQYHPRGSAAFPLAFAKRCAREEGATVTTEFTEA